MSSSKRSGSAREGAGVILLAPGIGSHGGIQTYMRQTLTALAEYAIARGVQVRCISLSDSADVVSRGVPVVGCRYSKGTFALTAFRVAFKHRRSIAVIGHIGLSPVAWILWRLRVIREYVIVLHGIEAWRRLAVMDRWAARNASAIVAVSRYTAEHFGQANGIDPEGISIITPCIDATNTSSVQEARRASESLGVLTVSRLVSGDREKGIDILLRAVRQAGDVGAVIDLTVVGDGDDLPRLRRLTTELSLDGQVRYTGHISSDILESLYQSCDVFALPSRMEGFGIVFIEAMRWGKPCVGGNHGGTPEVIDDGLDGVLVEHGDVEGLAEALVCLARDPARRAAMGARASAKARTKYSFSEMRKGWNAVLERVGAG